MWSRYCLLSTGGHCPFLFAIRTFISFAFTALAWIPECPFQVTGLGVQYMTPLWRISYDKGFLALKDTMDQHYLFFLRCQCIYLWCLKFLQSSVTMRRTSQRQIMAEWKHRKKLTFIKPPHLKVFITENTTISWFLQFELILLISIPEGILTYLFAFSHHLISDKKAIYS